MQNFVFAPPLISGVFNPAITGSYGTNSTWIPASLLNTTQLQNLENGTEISFCSGCTQYNVGTQDAYAYWIISDKHSPFLLAFHYHFYNIANASLTETALGNEAYIESCPYFMTNCNLITWINTKTSQSLTAMNITSNTSAGQVLTVSVSLSAGDLWSQIVLMFGFISGMQTFSSGIWFMAVFNFALFMTFMYCIIGEILIPFGIKIPLV